MYKNEYAMIFIFNDLSMRFQGNNFNTVDFSKISFLVFFKYEIFSLLKLFGK